MANTEEVPKELKWIIRGYALLLLYKVYLLNMMFITHGHIESLSTNLSLGILFANLILNIIIFQGLRNRKSWSWAWFWLLAMQSVTSAIKSDIGVIGMIEILYCLAAVYFIWQPNVKNYFKPDKKEQA